MIDGMRLGIADHFGWAVAVTASSEHRVVDRRRIELVEPDVCPAPVHYEGARLGVAGTAELVEQVRASVARASAASLDELAASLPRSITSISLRTWPTDFPTDIETLLRSPWEARADAVMYREVLAALAADRGWQVHLYQAKGIEDRAGEVLGDRAHDLLHGPRARLGAPWTKDHRTALAAAVLAS
jgi:hypothetical protein